MKKLIAAALVLCPLAASHATTITYTDEATFLSQVAPDYYLEDFTTYTYGDPLSGQTSQLFSSGGFEYTASAPNGLWSNESAISTNFATDTLRITFSGRPVTALGGIVGSTDISGNLSLGDSVVVRTNDGTSITIVTPDGGGFAGFVSDTPITSVTFKTSDSADGLWPQLDHFYVAAVPEPGVIALGIATSGLLLMRKRRPASES